jgi:hypothetical protein
VPGVGEVVARVLPEHRAHAGRVQDQRDLRPRDGVARREQRVAADEVVVEGDLPAVPELRVLAAMRDLGLTAPGDLAVIGFDDNGYGALATPALTTVHIDAEAHGRQTARAILGLGSLAGGAPRTPQVGLFPAPGRVIARESA